MAETIGTVTVDIAVRGVGKSKANLWILGFIARMLGINLTVESSNQKNAKKLYCVAFYVEQAIEFAEKMNMPVRDIVNVNRVEQIMGVEKGILYVLLSFSLVKHGISIIEYCASQGWEIIYV